VNALEIVQYVIDGGEKAIKILFIDIEGGRNLTLSAPIELRCASN
jgi:hypothetical protein